MISARNRSKQQTIFIIIMLGALSAITPFSIDMYLPAFPVISNEMHTTIQNVALSVSTYFLGFAAGQILYGPLLDRFGRKRPLYIGIFLYIIATIICSTSTSINGLLIIRFLQALCGCVASVAAMAMVRDFFPPEKSASIISLLILIIGTSPLLAPTAGSFVLSSFGWRSIFIALAILAFVILTIVFFFLPEAQAPQHSISLKPRPILKGFFDILSQRRFYIFALSGTFSFSGLFVYVAGSPGIFMDGFQVSPKTYSGIFALLSVGFIGSSQLNHLLIKKFTSENILRVISVIQTITSAIFFVGVLNDFYGLTVTIILLFIILACTGIVYPNAAAIALAPFEKNAGSASALLGFIQIGIGGLVSSGIGFLHAKGSFPTALIMIITSATGLLILLSGKKINVKDISNAPQIH